jgi:hypothetical protein
VLAGGATADKSAGRKPHPIALGITTLNAPSPGEISAYTKLVGTAPAIVMFYPEFDTPLFTHQQMSDIVAERATPLISWRPTRNWNQPVQFSEIASGADDAYLQHQAIKARRTHREILVRFGYEMNLSGADYGSHVAGETPATFIAAWRHIVDVFRSERATNVQWVWSPNTDCGGTCPFTKYFPGNRYVNWLGLDGYNFSTAHNVPWLTLHYIFASSYRTITALSSKPLMIAETASAPGPGDKAQWIHQGFMRTIPRKFPRVRAVVWFDQNKEADWRVNSSPQSLQAWRKVASSRLYSGQLGQ